MRFFSWPINCCKKSSSRTPLRSEVAFKDDPTSVPYFSFRHRQLIGYPCHIYDGDTFSIVFRKSDFFLTPGIVVDNIGDDGWTKYRCRMYGYDSPEIKPLLKTPDREEVIRKARMAKLRLQELLMRNPEGWVRIECGDFDKYGRILVKVWNGVDDMAINDIMLQEGHGYPYFGGTKMTSSL